MAGFDLHNTFRVIALATRIRREQRGQALVEYGLIVTLVSLVVVAALLAMSGELGTVFGDAVAAIDTVVP